MKKEKEDLSLEVSELKQKLNLKKTELITVQQELDEKAALLSLSELRIQQVVNIINKIIHQVFIFFYYYR